MKGLIKELNSHRASAKPVGGVKLKTKGGTTAHTAAHHRTTLQVDSEQLAVTAQKLAHGDVAREEKLVHWAEKHGLDSKVGNAVLSRLEHPPAQTQGGGKQQVEASHKAEEAATLKQKQVAEAKLKAQEAVKRQQVAAERKLASREHTYLAGLSPHRRKLIHWAEANGLPQKMAENPADKAKVKKIIARMKAEAMVASIKNQFRWALGFRV